MIRLALFVLLLCINSHCEARRHVPSDFEILTQVAWHEARGESSHVQQLVLDVLVNRSVRDNRTLYETVTAKSQFSWAKGVKNWKLSDEQAAFGFKLIQSISPVRSRYYHFNNKPIKYTKTNIKIGNMYFSEG